MWQDVAIRKDRQNDILFLLMVIMVIVNTEHCMNNMGHVKSSVSGVNPATANPRHTWDTFGSRSILRQHFRLGYRLVSVKAWLRVLVKAGVAITTASLGQYFCSHY